MALCTFPFLCILVITEYLIEPGLKAGLLSRRLIILFNLLFTLLTLVLACLCTSGFNQLCASMRKAGSDDCNERINFKIIEYPCESQQDCGVVYDIRDGVVRFIKSNRLNKTTPLQVRHFTPPWRRPAHYHGYCSPQLSHWIVLILFTIKQGQQMCSFSDNLVVSKIMPTVKKTK